MQIPEQPFLENNEKLKEFAETLRREYRREHYITSIFTNFLIGGFSAYKAEVDPSHIYEMLTKCTFVYNFRKRRHMWINVGREPHFKHLCLYQNLTYLKVFFGADIDINIFKGIDNKINTLCIEDVIKQLQTMTNME